MKHFISLTFCFLLYLPNLLAQCNPAWPVVSGANQTIAVNSRLLTGTSLTNNLVINAGVTLCTEGTASIDVHELTNNGTINHHGTGIFTADRTVINNGSITSTSVGFTKNNSSFPITNSSNASFTCAGVISIAASLFTNGSNATFSSTGLGNDFSINCDTDNHGDITSDADFIKTNSGNYLHCHTGANIIVQNNINIAASLLTLDVAAQILALNNVDLRGTILNSGLIEAQTGYLDKTFDSGNPITNTSTGSIKSFANMTIEAMVTNSGLIEITNGGNFVKTNTSQIINNTSDGRIIIRGASSNFNLNGTINNDGYILCEGDANGTASTSNHLNNSSTAYVNICGNYSKRASIINEGRIDVGGSLIITGSSGNILRNNSTGTINIVNDFTFHCNLENYSQIIVGNLLHKTGSSSSAITITDAGVIFTEDYTHDNGDLIGGATAATKGFLKINGTSQTLNGVNLSGHIDICDNGHSGIAPYFDAESPVYPYPTANITDCNTLPAGANGSFSHSCTIIILPIELVSFTVKEKNKEVELKWTTSSQSNNAYFSIERSQNGLNFKEIISIKGEKNSNTLINYTYYDKEPYEDISYYRLKQTDFDGTLTHSLVRSVKMELAKKSELFIYPNPSERFVTVQGDKEEIANIEIYSLLGENVTTLTSIISISKTNKMIDLSRLAQGVYIIKTKTNTKNIIYINK